MNDIHESTAERRTAARVTPKDVIDNIAAAQYFTAADGVRGKACKNSPEDIVRVVMWDDGLPENQPLNLLTFCVLTMRNGATITGEHTCTDPNRFDAEMARKIARFDAIQKARPLMEYAAKERLREAT